MNDLRKAAQMALEVLDKCAAVCPASMEHKALRAALAQPEQLVVGGDDLPTLTKWTPQRKPLTEEEVFRVAYAEFPYWSQDIQSAFVTQFARAIERAHGIGGEE